MKKEVKIILVSCLFAIVNFSIRAERQFTGKVLLDRLLKLAVFHMK